MENRLVRNCIQCLCSLSGGETNVNSIIKKTGLYKNYVFEAKRTLKKAQLITVSPDPNHEQRQILKLTESGGELTRLMKAITEFNKSYAQLTSSVNVNFLFDEQNKKALKNKLLAMNWKKDDIKHYSTIKEAAHFCKEFSMNLFSEALITRYYLLFARFRLNVEAKSILVKVITDSLSEQLLTRQQESEINTIGWTANEIISHFHPSLLEWLEGGDLYPFGLTDDKTVEIRSVCRSLLQVMAPPKEYVRDSLEQLIREGISNKSLTSIYDEYLISS